MAGKRSSIDISIIVFGVFMFILSISLFGVAGKLDKATGTDQFANLAVILTRIQYGVASWYLLTAVLAIASGATGHKGPYTAVIVLATLATFVALGAMVAAIWGMVAQTFRVIQEHKQSPIYPSFGTTDSFYPDQDLINGLVDSIAGLPVGLCVINSLSFIFMIVVSSLACCGVCCNDPTPAPIATTTIVTTSGGYSNAPPAYVGYAPNQPYTTHQGIGNPNYGQQDFGMNSYKQ